MKRNLLVTTMLSAIMALSLVACKDDSTQTPEAAPSTTQTPAAPEKYTVATELTGVCLDAYEMHLKSIELYPPVIDIEINTLNEKVKNELLAATEDECTEMFENRRMEVESFKEIAEDFKEAPES